MNKYSVIIANTDINDSWSHEFGSYDSREEAIKQAEDISNNGCIFTMDLDENILSTCLVLVQDNERDKCDDESLVFNKKFIT